MDSQIFGSVWELGNTDIHVCFLPAGVGRVELVKKFGQQGRGANL